MHERWLRLVLNDYESSFYGMLFTLHEKKIHQSCINVLLTKERKNLKRPSPELMNKVFYLRQNHYNLGMSLPRIIQVTNHVKFYCLPSKSTMASTIL